MNLGPLAWLLILGLQAPNQKSPVPDPSAQKDREKLIREVFKDEYEKKGTPDRAALARTLLAQANDTKDDPASRYVLLREARDLAAQSGDLEVAAKAVERIGADFDVDILSMKSDVLSACGRSAKTPEECQKLAKAFLSLTDEAVALRQYEAAGKAADQACSFARRAKDVSLATRSELLVRQLSEQKARAEKARKAREILGATPNDPSANLDVGLFEAAVRGNWDSGLPHLARGPDGTMKLLAAKELSSPSAPADQLAIADGWWDLSDDEKDAVLKEGFLRHAREWYRRVSPGLSGLSKVKAERRTGDEGRESAGGAMTERASDGIDLLKLVDLNLDVVFGSWSQKGKSLVSPTDKFDRLQIPFIPPLEYDLRIDIERVEGVDALDVGLVWSGVQFVACIDGYGGEVSGFEMLDGKRAENNETRHDGRLLPQGRSVSIVYSVRNDSIGVAVAGRKAFEWKGEPRMLSVHPVWQVKRGDTLFLGTYLTRFLIRKVTLLEISGTGKVIR